MRALLVDRISSLARIRLTEDEKIELGASIDKILDFFAELDKVSFDTEKNFGILSSFDTWDEPDPQEQNVELVLENAPGREGVFFVVPKSLPLH